MRESYCLFVIVADIKYLQVLQVFKIAVGFKVTVIILRFDVASSATIKQLS